MAVRTGNHIEQWLRFFLVGITETSRDAIHTFRGILALREELEHNAIHTLGRKAAIARNLMHLLYKHPLITVQQAAETLKISRPTASGLIQHFCALGILRETTGFKRNKVYVFDRYLALFLGDKPSPPATRL